MMKIKTNTNMNKKNKKVKKYHNHLKIVYQLIMHNKLHKKNFIKQVFNTNHKDI